MVLLLPDHRGCLFESRPILARKKCRTEACLPLRGLTTQTPPSAHLRFCVGACSRWEAKATHGPRNVPFDLQDLTHFRFMDTTRVQILEVLTTHEPSNVPP